MRPYIGVTGFMNRTDAEEILKIWPDNAKYDLMIGVLASSKTINGTPNKWPKRYPQPLRIRSIFPNHPHALNLIHYSTDNPDNLLNEMSGISEIAGENFHGFQLNIPWPVREELIHYSHLGYGNQRVVLQIGERALRMIDHSPAKLAARLRKNYWPVDYLLLDQSAGQGKPLDPIKLREYLLELYSADLTMKIGISGGLNSDTLYLINNLIREFPDLSIDAEGRLRDHEDNLHVGSAIEYAAKALRMFGDLPPLANED